MYKGPVKGRKIKLINLLEKIIMNKMSVEEADEVLDQIIDNFHNDELQTTPQKELCLDAFEWTAIGHGIDLKVLAIWRRDGWPSSCGNCGKLINYKKFGWKIVNDKLVCIKC